MCVMLLGSVFLSETVYHDLFVYVCMYMWLGISMCVCMCVAVCVCVCVTLLGSVFYSEAAFCYLQSSLSARRKNHLLLKLTSSFVDVFDFPKLELQSPKTQHRRSLIQQEVKLEYKQFAET